MTITIMNMIQHFGQWGVAHLTKIVMESAWYWGHKIGQTLTSRCSQSQSENRSGNQSKTT